MAPKTQETNQQNHKPEARSHNRRRNMKFLALGAVAALGLGVTRAQMGGDGGGASETRATNVANTGTAATTVEAQTPAQLVLEQSNSTEQASELTIEQQAYNESNEIAGVILGLAESRPDAAITGDTSLVEDYGYTMTIIRADVQSGPGNYTLVGRTLFNTDTDGAYPESPFTEVDIYYSLNPDGSLPKQPDTSVILAQLPISERERGPTVWQLTTASSESSADNLSLTTAEGDPNQLTPDILRTRLDPIDQVLAMVTPADLVNL